MTYRCLPKDCWQIIGKRCTLSTQFKIAATCSKLRTLYYKEHNLEKWQTLIDQEYTGSLEEAAQYKHWDLINYIIYKCTNAGRLVSWNSGLIGAIKCTDDIARRDMVDYFIEKGAAPWEWGLRVAARYGHRDLIDLFISKGAHHWDNALYGAARNGRRDLVDYIISKSISDNVLNLNYGLSGAARGGYRDLVDFFISKGADNFDYGLASAAHGNHRDLVDFFISKGAWDLKLGLYGAARGGHRDLVDFFISKHNEDTNNNDIIFWNWGLEGAQKGGHGELVDLFTAEKKQINKKRVKR